MASLLDLARRRSAAPQGEERALGWALDQFSYMGSRYLLNGSTTYGQQEQVRVDGEGNAYASNGVVAAVVGRRIDLFSQASFCWKKFGAAPKPMAGDVFTDAALAPLDDCVDLLTWMEFDVATAGNSFVARFGDTMTRLPPEWMTIIVGSDMAEDGDEHPEQAPDARVVGYVFKSPQGETSYFTADEVAHYAPKPDPAARFRGMSYLRPVLRQVTNQNAYANFLTQYWNNAATPNLVMKFPPEVQRQTIEVFRDLFNERHEGAGRAFRTAFLGGGADPVVVGANLKDLAAESVSSFDFAQICAAAGVPPIVVTIVPGLEAAATYANHESSMRSFADLTMRPLWRRAAIKLRPLVNPIPRDFRGRQNAELWYDVSAVSALQRDAQDDANIISTNAQTIRALADGGWDKSSVVEAVTTGDLSRLKDTGLVSVQLLPPGTVAKSSAPSAAKSGDLDELETMLGAVPELAAAEPQGL